MTRKEIALETFKYLDANGSPRKGKVSERIAHAFVSGFYVCGQLDGGAMMLLNLRGLSIILEWAREE